MGSQHVMGILVDTIKESEACSSMMVNTEKSICFGFNIADDLMLNTTIELGWRT